MTALTVIQKITGIAGSVVNLLIGLALVIFLWGIVQYVINDSEASKAQSIKYMTNGLIALFVMIAVWGLVRILDLTIFGGTGAEFILPIK